jgi:presenilin-like A22 family membrane protease
MKHTIKITGLIIGMFLLAQMLGLLVAHLYSGNTLPYGLSQPENASPVAILIQFIISLCFVILIVFGLMRLKAEKIFRIWFFIVILLALGVTFTAFLKSVPYASIISLVIALPLVYYKIIKHNILVHNITEMLIYPGIAALFIPLLSVWTAVILLLIISGYDMYAVWHSGIMQKMAKYQIQKVRIFAGFLVPYLAPAQRKLLEKAHSRASLKKVRVSVAMLGGGDVVFPIILAGVVLMSRGLIPALLITLFATLGLSILLYYSQKGKFYPAMPFITLGCLLGLFIQWFI